MTEIAPEQAAFEAHRDALGGNRPWSDVRAPEREVWRVTARAAVAVAELTWDADLKAELTEVTAERDHYVNRINDLTAELALVRGELAALAEGADASS